MEQEKETQFVLQKLSSKSQKGEIVRCQQQKVNKLFIHGFSLCFLLTHDQPVGTIGELCPTISQ